MRLQSRIESLTTRHAKLDMRIGDEDRKPAPDRDALNRLKLAKLRIKDELERLRRSD